MDRSHLSVAMDQGQDDPFDWSVDQVVQYLCHNESSPWTVSKNPSPLPDREPFEAALREHGITGEVLLNGRLENFFRNDLKLKEGHYYSVDKAIQYARRNSAKYLAHLNQERLYYANTMNAMITNNISAPGTFNSRLISNHTIPHWDVSRPVSLIGSCDSVTDGDKLANEQLLTSLQMTQASPSPRIASITDTETPSASAKANGQDVTSSKSSPQIRQHEHIHIDDEGRKRRRLDLGTKGLQPSMESLAEIQPADSDTWYLGPQKLDPAKIFYPIQADSADDNWTLLASKFSTGQRLFVKRKLFLFSRMPAMKLPSQDGSSRTAIFPYKNDGVKSEKHRFFTLYTSYKGETTVTMKSTADYDTTVQYTANQKPREKEVDHYDYLLQKYPVKDDEDTYPVFGDSGSEGEYDSDTWREMDREKEELAIQAQTQPKYLLPQKVDMVIEQCIKDYQEKWKVKHLPKLALEAHILWLDALKNRCRNSRIKVMLDDIERLLSRLEKIKKELHGHDWTESSHLANQCQSMEQTVYGIEAQKWRISVLESQQCPPKPPPKPSPAVKQKKKVVEAHPDEESVDSSSDDESLGDFIVNDMEVDACGGEEKRKEDPSPDALSGIPEPISQAVVDTDSRSRSTSSKLQSISTHENVHGSNDVDNHASSDLANNQPRCGFYYSSDSETGGSTPPPTMKVDGQDIEVIDLTESPVPAGSTKQETLSPSQTPHGAIAGASSLRKLNLAPNGNREKTSKPVQAIANGSGVLKTWPRPSIQIDDERSKLLKKMIELLPEDLRSRMFDTLPKFSKEGFKLFVKDGLRALINKKQKVRGLNNCESDSVMRATALYIGWVSCQRLKHSGIGKALVQRALANINEDNTSTSINFENFARQLLELLRPHDTKTGLREKEGIISSTGESDDEQQPHSSRSPHKKRKRPVKEDQAVKSGQAAAKQRVEIQEQQRKKLEQRLERIGVSNSDPEHHPVSFEQPTIFLHPHIGRRVKPHQLAGIQFMWRELIQSEKRDGCLLAHTMGLGKTMQVISLLVTIAAAANSLDPSIRRQVPEFFHHSQTLILCPPSLIDNWYEEFLMWTPEEHALGPIRKVASSDPPEVRISTVDSWDSDGGILILSYNLFRSWVEPKQRKGQKTLPEAQVPAQIRDQLLKGPRIIVADEAHQMKNKDSLLAQAAAMIESKSRIALTGSPLANNLMDYYSMVDWISPKYLDKLPVFRAKYIEPIEQGLFFDSTFYEQRRSLKKLQVLKEILTPKVSRADISVLEGSLPRKVEFVITVPLTPVQKLVYNRYATSLLLEKKGFSPTNMTILSWLAILGLCCNHPACFYDKLEKRAEEQPPKNLIDDVEQESSPVEIPLSSLGFNDAMWTAQRELLSVYTDLDDPKYSHRAEIFVKIVEESVRVGDKILCFSHSIPTLDYLEKLLRLSGTRFNRLDGSTAVKSRQAAIKEFNNNPDLKVYLISTRAGGLGLNITGANRVIIFDFGFNPTWEEQAVGRAYRLGQDKPVYIYRFLAGGTFEEIIHNKSIFKQQLAMRVVDKKNVERSASKSIGDYLFPVKDVKKEDFSEYIGKDRDVLDKILQSDQSSCILNIALTETFRREDNEKLTEDEKKEIQQELELELLRQSDPAAYEKKMQEMYLQVNSTSPNFNNMPYRSSLLPPHNSTPLPHDLHYSLNGPVNGLSSFGPPRPAFNDITTTKPSNNLNLNLNGGPPPIRPEFISVTRPPVRPTESPAKAFTSLSNAQPSADDLSGLPGPVSVESLASRVSESE